MIKDLLVFARLATTDLLGTGHSLSAPAEHLAAAEQWLKRAHDMGVDGGVSYGYSALGGWRPPYRETSGYIAETFFDIARYRGDADSHARAVRICRWLIDVQNPDGSFSNPRYGPDGIVFDTGQDLIGLVRAYRETAEDSFRLGALRAADWLVNVADHEARWTRFEHLDTPHTYNTRTAWAMLQLNQVEYDGSRERVARANLDWALSQQQPSGFFGSCAFETGTDPFTHTIAYATRGLLESGLILDDSRYIDAARRCADASIAFLGDDGFLPARISVSGSASARYCCLTGNCQLAIVWSKLFASTGETRYKDAALRALEYVMRRQDIQTANVNVRGAIKGSHPVWGGYSPLTFPNWPAKFFVDAMILTMDWPR